MKKSTGWLQIVAGVILIGISLYFATTLALNNSSLNGSGNYIGPALILGGTLIYSGWKVVTKCNPN